jgi:Na+-translocating ferredoxin:NAD+ oxidoreductase RNF subunit RnfB
MPLSLYGCVHAVRLVNLFLSRVHLLHSQCAKCSVCLPKAPNPVISLHQLHKQLYQSTVSRKLAEPRNRNSSEVLETICVLKLE